MHLTLLDWAIVTCCLVLLSIFSIKTISLVKNATDFLAASRTGGRYIVSVASAMAGAGAVTIVAWFEMYYDSGFTGSWWGMMGLPLAVVITLSGWIYYRYRETRVLTMAEFFEKRYSRRFRILAGIMAYVSGILNFGVFPAVASRFFVYYCGFPPTVSMASLEVPTFAVVMFLTLGLALLYTMGGQVTVMLTDCVQGIFYGVAVLIVALVVYWQFGWTEIVQGLSIAPENASRLHPFRAMAVRDFNVWFWLIGTVGAFWNYNAWQGSQAYYCCSRTPHEQKMAAIIAGWRAIPQSLVVMLLALCAYTFLHHPDYAAQAAEVQAYVKTIPNEFVTHQMIVPIAIGNFLGAGIKGLLFVVVLFALITTQDTYLHSWGCIFIQDVYAPLRKSTKPLDSNLHVKFLRWSIVGSAVFSYLFSLFYPPAESILMYFAITGTIYLGGAGTVIIGGLYWRKSTTPAAYTAMVVGSALGVAGLVIPKFVPGWPINGQVMWLIAMVTSVVLFVIVSLLTGRGSEPVEMDRLLHRGKYAIAGEHVEHDSPLARRWHKLVGITSEFSPWDKVAAVALVSWNLMWVAVFTVGTVYNLVFEVSTESWARFWHIWIVFNLAISLPIVVWFTIGAIIDIRRTLADLSECGRQLDKEPLSSLEAVTHPSPASCRESDGTSPCKTP